MVLIGPTVKGWWPSARDGELDGFGDQIVGFPSHPYGFGINAPYFVALAMLTAASVCSALDVSRVWCDPGNHWLQGHAAWHVLTAGTLFWLYRFYERLPSGA